MKTIFDSRYIRLVERLKAKRRELGLTHAQVARRLAVPRSWVGKVEQRERRLDVLDVLRLCQVYGIRFSELERILEEEQEEKKRP